MTFNKDTIKRRSAYFIFWSWHLIYVVLAVALIVPELSLPLIKEVMAKNVPWHYLAYALTMALLPFVSVALGFFVFRGDHRGLMKYFYGFEMPLLLFLLARMITFRDASPGVTWLVVNILVALLTWFVFLWVQNRNKPGAKEQRVVLADNPLAIAGSTVLAMTGFYFGILFLIIMLPMAFEFITIVGKGLLELRFMDLVKAIINPLAWLLLIFIFFTIIQFLALPVVMIYLYMGQFIKRLPSLFTPARVMLVLTIIAINIAGFTYFNQQPQQAVFSLLDENMQPGKSQRTLLQQSTSIKKGLMNAYLARYRYISTTGLSQRIGRNYQSTFNLNDEQSAIPQKLFNALATPFLYEGENWNDVEKAEKRYTEFFDAPIQKAERDSILKAVKHNWQRVSGNAAGLLDAANHYVHVKQQSIQIKENAGVATITVSHTLENLTEQQKEAVIHFSLPEDAVVTGLWLSDTIDKPEKYAYVVAPKGAAQAVYKAEVSRRVDPALLEKTGPYQYRLRVFPIPGKLKLEIPAKPMSVKFEYQTLMNVNIQWPLPKVLEKRNLFWDDSSEYWVNGKKVIKKDPSRWLPRDIPEPTNGAIAASLTIQQGDEKITALPRQLFKLKMPAQGHFAILIDGSYSMTSHYAKMAKEIALAKTSGAKFTLYFCRQQCSLLNNVAQLEKQYFFGSSQTADQLAAFSKLNKSNKYDAIFVLTDSGSYELTSTTQPEDLPVSAPLWLVHLGNTLPYAYDDKILDLIYQSKGGITRSLKAALILNKPAEKVVANECGSNSFTLATTRNRVWNAVVGSDHHCPFRNNNPALRKIYAAHHIKYLTRTMNMKQLDQLDTIHALAKAQGIVTHYSSMLVLVNDRQKEALKRAEQADDRFDREIEDGKQSTSNPLDPFAVPSVPEPEEWALMIIVGIFLSIAMLRRRKEQ